jgi:hypothetical protein
MSRLTTNVPASSVQRELSIRSESIQRIYNFYINNLFYVNRRYQRKLVWNIEEKRAFIDSIIKGFPVPIILLAETEKNKISVFEIIDGMQRLNAVTSFIEGEFDFDGKYFDLATMVESKSRLDQEILNQKNPILERNYCEIIASYILPISVYSFNDNKKVDEVFRRINSNGKYLSKQELRSAGATTQFPNLVRIISSEIRTDTSATDILRLNDMREISITNKQLEYGIRVDDIFWIKNNVLTKEMLRQSKDEEIIADIVAYMVLPDTPRSSSSILDEYYGFKEGSNQQEIETALGLRKPETIKKQIITIYDEIRKILELSEKIFSKLICDQQLKFMPRHFQVIFLSFYDLIFREKMEISNYDELIRCLKNISKDMDIRSGQTWSNQNKKRNINKVKGIIRDCFKKRNTNDPATDCWITEFETLLTQSKTEQNLYDFKQGFTKLDGRGEFDQDNFNKIIKTLTAMANYLPNATGYICVGVADNNQAAQRIENLYKITPLVYKNFQITGIEHEAKRLEGSLDQFYLWLTQQIKAQPIDQTTKDNLGRNIKIINYYDKDVVLFSINAGKEPTAYNEKYYQRIGANIEEIKFTEYAELFRRFSQST